jgi:hypothetical protein
LKSSQKLSFEIVGARERKSQRLEQAMKERIRDKSAKREMKLKNVGAKKGEGRTLGNIEAVGVAGAAESWCGACG